MLLCIQHNLYVAVEFSNIFMFFILGITCLTNETDHSTKKSKEKNNNKAGEG